MASGPAKVAEELPDNIRAMIDRVLEADIRKQISERGQDLASLVADGTSAAADRAHEMWRDSAPARRDALKTVDPHGAARSARPSATSGSAGRWRSVLRVPRSRSGASSLRAPRRGCDDSSVASSGTGVRSSSDS